VELLDFVVDDNDATGATEDVFPEPGKAALLPPLLLIKPEGTYGEVLQRGPCHGQLGPAEVIAQEIKAPFDSTDEGLLGMFLQPREDRTWFRTRTARRSFQRVGASSRISSIKRT